MNSVLLKKLSITLADTPQPDSVRQRKRTPRANRPVILSFAPDPEIDCVQCAARERQGSPLGAQEHAGGLQFGRHHQHHRSLRRSRRLRGLIGVHRSGYPNSAQCTYHSVQAQNLNRCAKSRSSAHSRSSPSRRRVGSRRQSQNHRRRRDSDRHGLPAARTVRSLIPKSPGILDLTIAARAVTVFGRTSSRWPTRLPSSAGR